MERVRKAIITCPKCFVSKILIVSNNLGLFEVNNTIAQVFCTPEYELEYGCGLRVGDDHIDLVILRGEYEYTRKYGDT